MYAGFSQILHWLQWRKSKFSKLCDSQEVLERGHITFFMNFSCCQKYLQQLTRNFMKNFSVYERTSIFLSKICKVTLFVVCSQTTQCTATIQTSSSSAVATTWRQQRRLCFWLFCCKLLFCCACVCVAMPAVVWLYMYWHGRRHKRCHWAFLLSFLGICAWMLSILIILTA